MGPKPDLSPWAKHLIMHRSTSAFTHCGHKVLEAELFDSEAGVPVQRGFEVPRAQARGATTMFADREVACDS